MISLRSARLSEFSGLLQRIVVQWRHAFGHNARCRTLFSRMHPLMQHFEPAYLAVHDLIAGDVEAFTARYMDDLYGPVLARDFNPTQLRRLRTFFLHLSSLERLLTPDARDQQSNLLGRIMEAQEWIHGHKLKVMVHEGQAGYIILRDSDGEIAFTRYDEHGVALATEVVPPHQSVLGVTAERTFNHAYERLRQEGWNTLLQEATAHEIRQRHAPPRIVASQNPWDHL